MRIVLSLSLLFVVQISVAQGHRALLKEQAAFEEHWLKTYQGLNGSRDEKAKLKAMSSLPFFAFDSTFRVTATLDTKLSDYFPIETTQHRPALYRIYGVVAFTLEGKAYRMPIYQSKLSVMQGASELFFPFSDLTNGHGTYDGGRYIEIPIPTSKTFILDFNKSFNPYCVYSHQYSCELVPQENFFDIEIKAGIRVEAEK